MSKVFITGATGFIGGSLFKALVEEPDISSFVILVRDKEKALEKLSEIIKKAGNLGKTVQFVVGDIIKENFGLSNEDFSILDEVNEVYHLASSVLLSNDWKARNILFKSNISGTKNLLEIFKDSKNLKQIYYFSSAYACGKTKEIVKEDWLEKPEGFRNYYEKSKWLTEGLIKKYIEEFDVPIVILRPSIAVVNNESQFLKMRYQTIYLFSRILKKAFDYQKEDKPIQIVGKYSDFLNIFPVGDIIKTLLEIRKSKNKKQIYHLTISKSLSTKPFLEGIEEGLGFKSGFPVVEKLENASKLEKILNKRISIFITYNFDDYLKWDINNTLGIRKKLKIKAKDNNWLKKHIKDYIKFLKDLKKK